MAAYPVIPQALELAPYVVPLELRERLYYRASYCTSSQMNAEADRFVVLAAHYQKL